MPFTDSHTCGATTRGGGSCRQAVARSGRCREHAGKTPDRLASPGARPDRRSRDAPTHLLDRYQQALEDPELLSIRRDVALLEVLFGDRLAAWEAAQAGPDSHDVAEQVEYVAEHLPTWDWTRVENELRSLAEAVDQRRSEGLLLDEIRDLMDQRARLAAQEHRRMLDLGQVLTVEQITILASAIGSVVRDLIPDEAGRIAFNDRIMSTLPVREPGDNHC